ncbi:hypothetical protein MJD09_10310, partial [bacterium]|nr:hypothetical protein [bacterium]
MMAMHKSDELREVIASVFEQMKSLGFDPRATSLGIYKEDVSSEHWFAGFTHEVLPQSYHIPYCEHRYYQDEVAHWKNRLAFKELIFEGNDKVEYAKWLFKNSDFKNLPAEFKKEMINPKRLYISNAYMKYGFIEALGDDPASEETISVIKRFANVFEQCYTRFVDLQKAEQQAREAQIETSLERVRAASMAMHKSEELINVATVMYGEFKNLGMTQSAYCGFALIDEEREVQEFWGSQTDSNLMERFTLPLFGDRVFQERYEAWKRKEPLFRQILNPAELKKHLEVAVPDAQATEDEKRAKADMPKTTHFYFGNFRQGYLQIISSEPLNEEQESILARFASVFQQTYTRFLDLQKAEDQAKEAQIEAALERVRSASMAMHKSDDLRSVIAVIFEQLGTLGFDTPACGLIIYDEVNLGMHNWFSGFGEEVFPQSYFIPEFDHPYYQAQKEGWKDGVAFKTFIFEDDLKKTYDNFVFSKSDFRKLPKTAIKTFKKKNKWILCDAFTSYGMIEIMGDEPISESKVLILQRFAKVFDQAYTRFLDVQKAEAQAREAQIEAALERVRARAMAMHHSDELKSVIATLFEQLQELDFDASGCSFVIFNKTDKSYVQWMSGFGKEIYPESYHVPYFDHPYYNAQLEAWQEGEEYLEFRLDRALKDSYGEFVFEHSDFKKLPQKIKDAINLDDVWMMCNAFMSHGAIEAVTGAEPLPLEQADILKRFAKVFDQTYTRFLDLQKAEEQAREAQIETALERVRARTMAMHKSEELADAASVLFQQLAALGIEPAVCGFTILNHENYMGDLYFSVKGKVFPQKTSFPHDLTRNTRKIYNEWKKGSEFLTTVMKGKRQEQENRKLDAYWKAQGVELFSDLTEFFEEQGIAEMRKKQVVHYAYFSHGFLHFSHHKHVSEVEVLKRFAKIFDQTYTRFLDLQKAEEQAREAQIEAALERVRAAGMAMHYSEDLAEASTILFEQLADLGIEARRVGFALPDDEKQQFTIWSTVRDDHGKASLLSAFLYYDQHLLYPKMIGDWHAGKKIFRYELHGRDLQNYYKSWNKTFETPKALLRTLKENTSEYYQFASFDQGMIYAFTAQPLNEGQHQLLLRFANAFELTYTRFLDLKKAEAQAREAQVEAALERVRSRTMGMRRSEELSETASLLFKQIGDLGTQAWSSGFQIWNADDISTTAWMTAPDGEMLTPLRLPHTEDPYFQNIYDARQGVEAFFVMESKGKELEET